MLWEIDGRIINAADEEIIRDFSHPFILSSSEVKLGDSVSYQSRQLCALHGMVFYVEKPAHMP